MTNDDFTPSPQLAAGLARSSDDGRPLYELVVPRREIIDDLHDVPDGATFLATRGTANGVARIGALPNLQALWANPATPALFRACAESASLRAVYACHFKTLDNIALNGAPALEHVMLGWAPKLIDLTFLRELPALRTIYLEDMKRVDLSTLPELPNVTGLYLGGGMWSPLKVASLEPLTRLSGLRYLRLTNVRPLDGRLQPLTQLSELRELHLPNFFQLEEVARLAGALRDVKSNTLTPEYAPRERTNAESSRYACKRCGGARQMMTGKPASFLCPDCDSSRYGKRVLRWELARLTPWPRSDNAAS